jgi:aryl-alcohol dehydrogenase-like predicted oxidoreductase
VNSRLALGTVQFGIPYGIANKDGQVSRQEAKAMLQVAAAAGIDTIDTAIAYGDSEVCLGEIGTRGFKLVTKLPPIPDDCADVSAWVDHQFRASLARLGVTTVYGLLLHRSEQLLGPRGAALYRTLQALKDAGKVQQLGVSVYSPNELDALIPLYRLDLVQAPFNLVDQRLLRTGWLGRLKDNGVEVHTRSVFLQGLLLMTKAELPAKFAPWNDLWFRWQRWLTDSEMSAVQACLAFPLSFAEIDRVIVGADSVSQFTQILYFIKSRLTHQLPDMQCDDEKLIDPSKWPTF